MQIAKPCVVSLACQIALIQSWGSKPISPDTSQRPGPLGSWHMIIRPLGFLTQQECSTQIQAPALSQCGHLMPLTSHTPSSVNKQRNRGRHIHSATHGLSIYSAVRRRGLPLQSTIHRETERYDYLQHTTRGHAFHSVGISYPLQVGYPQHGIAIVVEFRSALYCVSPPCTALGKAAIVLIVSAYQPMCAVPMGFEYHRLSSFRGPLCNPPSQHKSSVPQ